MSLLTLEVEIDHGRVIPRGGETLPENARALLTLLPATTAKRDPLTPHPELMNIKFYEDPTMPLEPEDWPEAFS